MECIIFPLSFSCVLSFFFRDLDARAKNEWYRASFRLPKDERLDGHTDCTLWTPFNKIHIPGQMFVSNNYICFASKAEEACHLIIPLREVRHCFLRMNCLSISLLLSYILIQFFQKIFEGLFLSVSRLAYWLNNFLG